ncbi:ankyrin repeat-containing protein [Legionella gratiana]|uniref:Ankyrin repeat-containing protein n=1 Tax=Legionella gratiana TaxID=45066 RepID=A0A378J5V9_9GAMM|nr:ankyrin repeat domain-containing protein [Legionella gratiana]KTD05879.1 ankyrin repeat-containing protein [Legionella gratiana]STX42307.1 ankyrin repeat-containing protein [Legionella gratiana]
MKTKIENEFQGIQLIRNLIQKMPYESYRLAIDGIKQSEGCVDQWELREPGSLTGVLNGFDFVIKTLSEYTGPSFVPNSQFLKNLHLVCTKHVQKLNKGSLPGQFRDGEARYGLGDDNSTNNGMSDIKNHPRSNAYFNINQNSVDHRGFGWNLKNQDTIDTEIEKQVTIIFGEYEKAIQLSQNDDDKIEAITRCIQELEWLHPFGDANCRTICVLLLNTLLLSQNLNPVILNDPNRFDGYATKELIDEIKKGQDNFLLLLQKQNKFSFNSRRIFTDGPSAQINDVTDFDKLPDCIKYSTLYLNHTGNEYLLGIASSMQKTLELNEQNKKYLDDILSICIKYKNKELLEYFLDNNFIDINRRDKNNDTLLHIALKNNSVDIAKLLLEKNINISPINNQGLSVLNLAVNNNYMLKMLMDFDPSVLSKQDNNGQTLLHLAIYTRNTELVSFLINKAKVDLNIKNNSNESPLIFAIKSIHSEYGYEKSKQIIQSISQAMNNEINFEELLTVLFNNEELFLNHQLTLINLIFGEGQAIDLASKINNPSLKTQFFSLLINRDIENKEFKDFQYFSFLNLESIFNSSEEYKEMIDGLILYAISCPNPDNLKLLLEKHYIDKSTELSNGSSIFDFALKKGALASINLLIDNENASHLEDEDAFIDFLTSKHAASPIEIIEFLKKNEQWKELIRNNRKILPTLAYYSIEKQVFKFIVDSGAVYKQKDLAWELQDNPNSKYTTIYIDFLCDKQKKVMNETSGAINNIQNVSLLFDSLSKRFDQLKNKPKGDDKLELQIVKTCLCYLMGGISEKKFSKIIKEINNDEKNYSWLFKVKQLTLSSLKEFQQLEDNQKLDLKF